MPGRLNEKLVDGIPEGVYYGQCSELCGSRHAYMPIAIEALPPEKFAAWVESQGGTMPGEEAAAPAAPAEAPEAEQVAALTAR